MRLDIDPKSNYAFKCDGQVAPEGVIAIQLFSPSGPAKVMFKDIRIKELP